mmetsp:Transcript_39923/g.39495  ORF Transcript_39923/g.39495 Transcript_39923/m.39495 type:complete len:111 (+) Transcript_39923:3-335(+)
MKLEKTKQEEEEKRLEGMTPQQLNDVKKTLEEDVKSLNQSLQGMKLAGSKFRESKGVVESIKNHDMEEEIMIPLTSSLYVPGRICETDKVVVEVGAGYFIEVTPDKAKEY